MSTSTSAGSAESRCPLPLGTPVRPPSCSSWSAHPGPARGEVNVIEGGRRVAGNSGQPGRSVTRRTVVIVAGPRYPSASVESAAPPSSRNCVRLCLSATCVDDSEPDPHDAGWRAATGYQPRSPAARCLGANRRTPCCRQPPGQARGSVDNMRVVSTYRPRRLGRVRPGLAHDWFRAALHHSPARRTNGHTALTTVEHRFHLTCAICRVAAYLLTYTPVVDVGYRATSG
jgi:hypothetical protein